MTTTNLHLAPPEDVAATVAQLLRENDALRDEKDAWESQAVILKAHLDQAERDRALLGEQLNACSAAASAQASDIARCALLIDRLRFAGNALAAAAERLAGHATPCIKPTPQELLMLHLQWERAKENP